jgi:hypothetical protein
VDNTSIDPPGKIIEEYNLLIAEKIKLHEPERDPDSEEIALPD